MKISCPQLGHAGRLGNQLFQIAATYGIAKAHGAEPQFPAWDYQPFFNVPGEFFGVIDADAIEVSNFAPHIDERAKIYLQDLNLFSNVIQDITNKWFWPTPLATKILDQYRWVARLPRPILAVHIRRGDLASEDIGEYHPLRPKSYYDDAIHAMRTKGFASMVVFSDDIPWCIETFSDYPDALFFKGGELRLREHEPGYSTQPFTDWIDLCVMAWADMYILSNSTFAWWAAMLSWKPNVIYPDNWFGPRLDYIDTSLMFPSHWTRMHHAS